MEESQLFYRGMLVDDAGVKLTPRVAAFAGRVGSNQTQVIANRDASTAAALERMPDASPFIPWRDAIKLEPFLDPDIWRFAVMEAFGTMLLVFTTAWPALRAVGDNVPTQTTTLPASGVFGTPEFLGPLVGGFCNWILLALFIYTLGPISGAHLNPTITIAAFCARLVCLPRMILYLAGQVAGGTVAGLILRGGFGSRDFAVGGCTFDSSQVAVRDALLLEFIFTLSLITLIFGVALDPRQGPTIGPTLSPWLVGLTLGVLSWTSSFIRPGYYGASMNPARCFGSSVGSYFTSYHWIHWVGPLAACIMHSLVHSIVPPWQHLCASA